MYRLRLDKRGGLILMSSAKATQQRFIKMRLPELTFFSNYYHYFCKNSKSWILD